MLSSFVLEVVRATGQDDKPEEVLRPTKYGLRRPRVFKGCSGHHAGEYSSRNMVVWLASASQVSRIRLQSIVVALDHCGEEHRNERYKEESNSYLKLANITFHHLRNKLHAMIMTSEEPPGAKARG